VYVVAVLALLPLLAHSQERYQQVRIGLSAGRDLGSIAGLGIAVEHGRGKPGTWVDLFVSEAEAGRLRAAGFPLTVLIDDWATEYAKRLELDRKTPPLLHGVTVPAHFQLGSMGGFLTLEELKAQLASMHAMYPALVVGPDSIGSSVQGRPIWSMKISARASSEEDEPRALYTSLTHAREGGGMMVLVYFMWHLLEQYGVDPEITKLLESRELWFVPAVNPDGYAYNAAVAPAGGGLWRKNRRANADGSIGVDLNRNFGLSWGYDDKGSSPLASSLNYRGTAPFSEPETRAIQRLCIEKKFSTALNYHTYGNLLIYPWGYLDADTEDSLRYRALAQHLTRNNRYAYGTGGQTVGYITNGDAVDWMYGDSLAKPSVLAFTPEVGSDDDGFWPVPSRILPQVQENLDANIILAAAAGPYVRVGELSRIGGGTDSSLILFRLMDAGMSPVEGPVQVSIESEQLEVHPSVLEILPIANPVLVHVVVRDGTVPGQQARLVVRLSYAGGATRDTLSIRAGIPHLVFEETAEQDLSRWTVASNGAESHWGRTEERAARGRYSITDSPLKYYGNNTVTTLTLAQPLKLSGGGAELRFQARWEIESNYDIARVEASTDGSAWMPLAGRRTAPGSGSGRQSPQEPGYDGTQREWIEEVMDLDDYLGKDLFLRFVLESDADQPREGIFLDDIRVFAYDAILTEAPEARVPVRFALQQNYPNPFNPTSTIVFTLPRLARVRLSLYDVLGREISTLAEGSYEAGSHRVTLDATALSSGVYVCHMTADDFSAARKIVVLR